jgi:hypothetical protein
LKDEALTQQIADVPGAVEGLLSSSGQGVQEVAAWALVNLAYGA